jgi:IMP dehydrogenase
LNGTKNKNRKVSDKTRKKISEAGIERFKNPGNKEYLYKRTKYNHSQYKDNRRIIHKGYLARYENGKTIFMHREKYEEYYNYKLKPGEHVHHINCDSLDNSKENLALAKNKSDHKLIHSSLEKCAAKLVKCKIILFDRNKNEYYINPSINNNLLEQSLSFNNVAIKQKENICDSRLNVNIETEIIHGVKRPVGLIASNMLTVCNADFCISLYKLGAFGILHRAMNDDLLIYETKRIASSCKWVGTSIGVGKGQFELAKKLINAGSNIITIDIAHGFSSRVADLAKKIKQYNKNIKIIVGNLTNPDSIKIFYKHIDALKLGIANGQACETKNTAGCNEGQFSVVRKFKQLSIDFDIPVISDGSISEPADFVKAIAAGANSAMCGKIFAKCPESAAEVVKINGVKKKVYAGMASRYVQNKWRGGLKKGTCPEGKVIYLDIGESVSDLIERYSGALRSGITYAGGKDIKSFQDNVEFVRV